MAYRYGNREQLQLLPQSIEEYVASDDPVRVYDAFVESLDIEELGIVLEENKVGNTSYYPRSMIKLLVYGTSYGKRSSRKLERATYHNFSFIWLMGGLTPDHKTIARFRKDNRNAIKKILKQCAMLCIKLGLIEGNTLFVDGSKIRANAGIKNTWTQARCEKYLKHLDIRIESILSECEEVDVREEGDQSLVKLKDELKDKKALKSKIEAVMKELQEKVPRPHQGCKNNFNCDWCEDVWESKNCYLSRALFKCENLSYGYRVLTSKDSFDLVYCFDLQRSYNCLFCHNSFNLNFSENSKDCVDSNFLFDCRNCQNCTMSWNLRNKRYCIRNVQYTKEEYEKELAKFNFGSYKNIVILKEEFKRILKNEAVHRENFNIKTTNSTGNYMTNCDKCINVFSWENSQNCQNCIRGLNSKDSIDQAFTWNTENSGNNGTVDGGYQIKHSAHSVGRYSEYIDNCLEVEYCFGCVGLRKKKYCILNKQYTKEEYEKLKAKIVLDMGEEYGEFFPYSMGICDYNFSASILYFPQTTKEEILREGGYWSEEDFSSEDGISSLELPDAIKDTDLGICNQALICPQTHYRFNISQSEFEFHKNNNFALPREHFDRRMLEPARKMVVSKSYPYKCFYCQK